MVRQFFVLSRKMEYREGTGRWCKILNEELIVEKNLEGRTLQTFLESEKAIPDLLIYGINTFFYR